VTTLVIATGEEPPHGAEMARIDALLGSIALFYGRPALSDDHVIALRSSTSLRAPAGFVFATAADEAGELVGYGQAIGGGPTGWSFALAVAAAPAGRNGISERLARTVFEAISSNGGGQVSLWAYQAGPEDARLAESLGLTKDRTLYQMRCSLPPAEAVSIGTRPFVVGVDEPAWIEVNNRAFSSYPDQGHYDLAAIAAHEREPWFDPIGFLLCELEGRLAGFCWTKVHNSVPALGEIYVIAVDPDFTGRGLGRQLVLAGLAHLAGRGLRIGMLYVEADNIPAVKLYVDLGFVVDHIDNSYTTTLAPATSQ
jgi:mycothiol synthase